MARRRARTKNIEVDYRCEGLSAAALQCRHMGHKTNFIPMGPRRRLELAQLGQVEKVIRCERCDYERIVLIDVVERMVVSTRSKYADGYLIPKEYAGSGRIPRMEAFIAELVRTGDL